MSLFIQVPLPDSLAPCSGFVKASALVGAEGNRKERSAGGAEEPGPAAVFIPASQLLGSSCSKQELGVKASSFNDPIRLVNLPEGVDGTYSRSATERNECSSSGTAGELEDRSWKSGPEASLGDSCTASQPISSCSKVSNAMEYEAVDSRGQGSYTASSALSSQGGSLTHGSVALKGKGPSKPKNSKKLDTAVKQTPKLTYFFQKQVSCLTGFSVLHTLSYM